MVTLDAYDRVVDVGQIKDALAATTNNVSFLCCDVGGSASCGIPGGPGLGIRGLIGRHGIHSLSQVVEMLGGVRRW